MSDEAVVALGWATVDLERAAVELGRRLGLAARFVPVPRSETLGARCLAARTVPGTVLAGRVLPDRLLVLEPDTEGRLAGFLARHGEGWAATWLAPIAEGASATARPGPLGPERLVLDALVTEPFRLRLSAATIEP
jgi:hypothetical protein